MKRLVVCGIFLLLPSLVNAARISLDPEKGVYGRGDTFVVSVRVHTENECINAAEINMSYSESLRAVDFSRGGSVMSLWVQEPKIDTDARTVTFSGGIPGGYCGRIQGDPAQSNVLGKVVFTVVGDGSEQGTITVDESSAVYLNDGRGTVAPLGFRGGTYSLGAVATQGVNPWVAQVQEDTIPPDPFEVIAESTKGVFSGRYYLVFSTIDKQSGIDHYEIFENGVWKNVTSPYEPKDQFLQSAIRIRAIDKAGNERIAEYVPGSESKRAVDMTNLWAALGVIGIFFGLSFVRMWMDRKPKDSELV